MSRCPHTMKAQGRDGITRCCDCGAVVKAGKPPMTAAPTPDTPREDTAAEAELARLRAERDADAVEIGRLKRELSEMERGKAAAIGLQQGGSLIIRQLEAEVAKAHARGRAEGIEEAALIADRRAALMETAADFQNRLTETALNTAQINRMSARACRKVRDDIRDLTPPKLKTVERGTTA